MDRNDHIVCAEPPVSLNCWKHHRNFILSQISVFTARQDGDAALKKGLTKLGDNALDLYVGFLPPANIGTEALVFLKNSNLLDKMAFSKWINEGGGYREIILSDGSRWTLRTGKEPGRHVHIHPSRYAWRSVRLKANSLKIAAAAFYLSFKSNEEPAALIETARTVFLGFSPLKAGNEEKAVLKAIGALTTSTP